MNYYQTKSSSSLFIAGGAGTRLHLQDAAPFRIRNPARRQWRSAESDFKRRTGSRPWIWSFKCQGAGVVVELLQAGACATFLSVYTGSNAVQLFSRTICWVDEGQVFRSCGEEEQVNAFFKTYLISISWFLIFLES